MNRKQFIKTCGFACAGISGLSVLLQSCNSTKTLSGTIVHSDLVVPLADFEITKHTIKEYRKYVVIQNEQLQYPICIYRLDEKNYSALLMVCSHQGAELQVFGDKLQCPAHGSEFNQKGEVENAPATSGLRRFPVTIEQDHLKISLKAQS